MALVLDTSIAGCWAFDDENHPLARQALDRLAASSAVVPALWWFELWNILAVNERRHRITQADTAQFLARIGRLPIETDRAPDGADMLAIARRNRLSAYDAAYLELAHRRGLPLATLDRALATAAAPEGVTLLVAD